MMGMRKKLQESIMSTPDLPTGFTECEYLECNGKQYTILGKCPTYIGARGVISYAEWQSNKHILSTASHDFVFLKAEQWSVGGITLGGAVNNVICNYWPPRRDLALSKLEVSQNWKMDGTASVGRADYGYNVKKDVFTKQLESASSSLFLFSYDYSSLYRFIGKLHEMQISSGDNVYMDLIPVLDQNDIPCMYDKVSKQCFRNLGSGTFGYKIKATGETVAPKST